MGVVQHQDSAGVVDTLHLLIYACERPCSSGRAQQTRDTHQDSRKRNTGSGYTNSALLKGDEMIVLSAL